jgi:hypothetical protein
MLNVEASSIEVIAGINRVLARVKLILSGSLQMYVRISHHDMRDTVNVRIGFFGESYFHLRESIKATFVF